MIIGNDPFDPDAQAKRYAGRPPRGRRLRNLIYGAGILGVGGFVALQAWLMGGGGEAETGEQITAARAEVPAFDLPQPPQAPPPVVIQPEPEDPRRQQAAKVRPPELPTRIAFAVQAQGEPDLGWFQDGRRPHLAHGCALRPGASTIPAALETVVQSEVAGQAIATVTADVFDPDGVGRLLIPAGTKAVGYYKTEGKLDFQSRRLGFVWNELTLPDGTSIHLGDGVGMDVAGSMGVGGEVDTRWGELIATAALLTVFDGIQRGGVSSDPGILAALQGSASNTTGRLGKEVTGRVLDWEPGILVAAGTRITISTRKTVQIC